MSWVSILEDAIKRFESDMHMMESELPSDQSQITETQYHDARRLLDKCQALLHDANKHLDVATDPDIELAIKISEANHQIAALRGEIQEYKRTCTSLQKQLGIERERADANEKERKKLRVILNQTEKRLEEAIKESPASIYDAYSKGIKKKITI